MCVLFHGLSQVNKGVSRNFNTRAQNEGSGRSQRVQGVVIRRGGLMHTVVNIDMSQSVIRRVVEMIKNDGKIQRLRGRQYLIDGSFGGGVVERVGNDKHCLEKMLLSDGVGGVGGAGGGEVACGGRSVCEGGGGCVRGAEEGEGGDGKGEQYEQRGQSSSSQQ